MILSGDRASDNCFFADRISFSGPTTFKLPGVLNQRAAHAHWLQWLNTCGEWAEGDRTRVWRGRGVSPRPSEANVSFAHLAEEPTTCRRMELRISPIESRGTRSFSASSE